MSLPTVGGALDNEVTVCRAAESEWAMLARSLWGYSYKQTWSYGEELASRRGAVSEHVLIRAKGRIVALADVRLKSLPFVGGGLAYVSGGPLMCVPPENDEFASYMGMAVRALKEEYAVRRGYVLRIAPPLGTVDRPAGVEEVVRHAGFGDADRSACYRTIRLDISRHLEQIRAGLAQKWRNALNGSLKQGLSVSVWEDSEAIARFAGLFDAFVARKGFTVDLDPRFYERVQRGLPLQDRLVTQFAEREGHILAGHISSMLGDTCVYLLGATSPAGLRSKAAYLLQWNTIVLAKERGLRWYDLGGVDPVDNPGVHHFKRGLGGQEVVAPGPFEVTPGRWWGMAARRAEAVYQYVRRQAAQKGRRPRHSKRAPGEANGV